MPISRTTSTGSATQKRTLPFKPPGPAKKPKTSTDEPEKPSGRSKGVIDRTASFPTASRTASKKPAPFVLDSSEDDNEFGDDIDLDDALSGEQPSTRPQTARQRQQQATTEHVHLPDDDDDDDDSDHHTTTNAPPPASQDSFPVIPANLLTRLLHESFTDKKTKIGKDANRAMGRYMELFVREAIARAALGKNERVQTLRDRAATDEGAGIDEGFLDVEDLERVAPGLLLDF
ncbi:hypothetical protein H2203_002198 [Taxawa tesnikishii (nom. ined.)]|nr:hypothetical protein H2203_002198 [Dothideales sp. JES 119]